MTGTSTRTSNKYLHMTFFHLSDTFKVSFSYIHTALELFFFGFYLLAQLAEADAHNLAATISTPVLNGLCIAMFVSIWSAFTVKYVQELCVRRAPRRSRVLFFTELAVWLLCLLGVLLFAVLLIGALLNEVFPSKSPATPMPLVMADADQDWTKSFDNIQGEYILFLLFAVRHWRSLPTLGWARSAFLQEPAPVVSTCKFRLVSAVEFVCIALQLVGYMFFIASQNVALDGYSVEMLVVGAFAVVQFAFLIKFAQEMCAPLRSRRFLAFVIQCALWLLSVVAALFFVVLFVLSLIKASQEDKGGGGGMPDLESERSALHAAFEEAQGPFILFLFFTVRTWRHLPTLGPSRSAFLEVHTSFERKKLTESTNLLVNQSDD